MHKFVLSLASVAFVAAVAGCDGGTDPTGTTGTTTDTDCDTVAGDTGCKFYDGPTLIDYVEASCSGSNIVISADTVGWTSDAVVNMTETNASPWDEEHGLASVSFGANGYWDLVEASLSEGAAVATQTPDVSSVFGCASHIDVPVMTYAIRVYDPDGVFADCAVWGQAPNSYIDGTYAGDALNPVSNPGELASCIVF